MKFDLLNFCMAADASDKANSLEDRVSQLEHEVEILKEIIINLSRSKRKKNIKKKVNH